ncbi:MAG: ATP-binding protein [Bacteroidetes bacterium]|nr:MAG: ATP-binding protein [Bacteroidota bacterium]RLD79460.1 MAG: ATP-binding protein [Bacteroidota bacterium]
MIAEFKVNNFLSFKEEQILSFEASSDKNLQEYHCVEVNPDEKLLRLAIIYGANASGKSNLLLAIDFLRKISLKNKNRSEKTGFIPFGFDDTKKREPGSFEISIYIEGVKYIYSVALDEDVIYEEKLVYYPGKQPATVFYRKHSTEENDYILKTGSTIKISLVELAVLKSNTLNNMTIVAGFSKTNIPFIELQLIYDWFKKGMSGIIRPMNDLYRQTISDISDKPIGYKQFIIENLENADFNITDIQIENEDILYPDKNEDAKFSIVSDNITRYQKKKVYFTHRTKDKQSKLSIDLQSSGTLQYLGLIGKLKNMIDDSSVLNIDELENSLHPDLVNHFINTFLYHSKKEDSQSQFIFTTHNVGLLAEDFVRKDIVWFTEKDEDGSTNLFSLNDFDIRKNLSFLKAYQAGKFGAVPNLGII